MAKFVYGYADRPFVDLDANEGEQIPVEMVLAWAQIRQAHALEAIAETIGDFNLTVSHGILHIGDKIG